MKRAIIDLGTNTCNLLIAHENNGEFSIIHSCKMAVMLGKGGINKQNITSQATQRAINAINSHINTINSFGGVNKICAIATSAVRDAKNKDEFAQEIFKNTGIKLNVISGNKEAELIYKGVVLALGNISNNNIVMDIGGGSNEFIISNDNKIIWKQSFRTGIARVIEKFNISNPITNSEILEIEDWFKSNMTDLWLITNDKEIDTLIGCSGTFDTIADIIDSIEATSKKRRKQIIDINDFKTVYKFLINTTIEQRKANKSIEDIRIEMIVPAVILINLVIRKLSIRQIIQTDYSLKEGALISNF